MSQTTASDVDRRSFLKIAASFVAGGVCGGALQEAGKDFYGYAKAVGMEPGAGTRRASRVAADLLFASDPLKSAVVPPGTNRHLLAKGIATPSRYVRVAYSAATGAQKSLVGTMRDLPLESTDPLLGLALHKHLLVLGGPVATELTRCLFGYKDARTSEGKLVPVPRPKWPLPFYFHVGNRLGFGRWGSELRMARRFMENGEERAAPLYGVRIGATGPLIAPPLQGDRVVGDMLMITRVPNPRNPKGTITMIGGLHGHSMESFFSNVNSSAGLVAQLLDGLKHDYFQMLLPFKIDNAGRAALSLDTSDPWHLRVSSVDGDRYLSCFGR